MDNAKVINTTDRLNDFILTIIQTNGIEYAVINYIALRNDYYAIRCPG